MTSNLLVRGIAASDVTLTPTDIHGASARPANTINVVGQGVRIRGGLGVNKFTVLDYTQVAGETLNLQVDGNGSSVSEPGDFAAATSNAVTAQNIADAINVDPQASVRVFARASGDDVLIELKESVLGSGVWLRSSEPAGALAVNGDQGSLEAIGVGNNSTQIGLGARAEFIDNIAIGVNAVAHRAFSFGPGNGTICIGPGAENNISNAEGSRSCVVIGANAKMEGGGGGGFGMAIGHGAQVTSAGSFGHAIGHTATVTGSAGTAIGGAASAASGVAVGRLASSSAGVAVGNGATATGFGHAFGIGSTAGSLSTALGYLTDASGTGNIAIGYLNQVTSASNAVSIGEQAGTEVMGSSQGVAVGYRVNTGTGASNVAIGASSSIQSPSTLCTVVGQAATVSFDSLIEVVNNANGTTGDTINFTVLGQPADSIVVDTDFVVGGSAAATILNIQTALAGKGVTSTVDPSNADVLRVNTSLSALSSTDTSFVLVTLQSGNSNATVVGQGALASTGLHQTVIGRNAQVRIRNRQRRADFTTVVGANAFIECGCRLWSLG